ncbi:MAG: PHP domain-containing protein [Clostridiales bacterium]|nr:PHP domain-containing protein [Clostridiales bacterium]
MKKFLISDKGTFYKANLHSHSTVSDGELTPLRIKELYQKNGYSIVAFTDHNRFVTHNDLTDSSFLALNGVENAADESGKGWFNRCCDICFIALNSDRRIHPFQNENNVIGDGEKSPFETEYTSECVNMMIKKGVENGFFVTYNHPTWSLENYPRYMSYSGMHAMEIFNTSSFIDGYNEYNPDIYDDMLRGGKKLFCIATDDNHNRAPGTCHWDSFGGFTMIKSPSLKYEDITGALLKGDFYSSRGPVINELWIDTDDGSVNIRCEKAKKIVCTRGGRRLRAIYAKEEGKEYLTGAKISVNRDDIYLRITVFDENGLTADTNAYFVKNMGIDFESPDLFVE